MEGSWFKMFKGNRIRIRIRGILLGGIGQHAMGEHIIELGMPMQVKENRSSVITVMGLDILKIVESKNANHSEHNHTWGSNATDIPLSSSLVMTGTTRLQGLWGMVTISWEMLLSQGYTM
ncbi:hypothetical protein Tco_1384624 [Tanacetum coccineum]